MLKPNVWTQDSDGEEWYINGPEVVIASNRPRKKGKPKMYANRPKHGTKAWMSYIRGMKKNAGGRKKKHHRKAKRNMYSAGMVANRPKTRTVVKYIRAKRNGPRTSAMLAGFGIPGIEPIAGAFAGLSVPPLLNYLVKGYLPTSLTSSKLGMYAIKAAEIIVPSWLVKKYVSRNVGNTMLIVGIGKLLYDVAQDVAPQVFGLSGMGFQPMLGVYPGQRRGLPAARQVPMMTTPMNSGVPDRLDANSRF